MLLVSRCVKRRFNIRFLPQKFPIRKQGGINCWCFAVCHLCTLCELNCFFSCRYCHCPPNHCKNKKRKVCFQMKQKWSVTHWEHKHNQAWSTQKALPISQVQLILLNYKTHHYSTSKLHLRPAQPARYSLPVVRRHSEREGWIFRRRVRLSLKTFTHQATIVEVHMWAKEPCWGGGSLWLA